MTDAEFLREIAAALPVIGPSWDLLAQADQRARILGIADRLEKLDAPTSENREEGRRPLSPWPKWKD